MTERAAMTHESQVICQAAGVGLVAVSMPTARTDPVDPPDELKALRTAQPMCRLAYPDGHIGWLVTGHALARAVLADTRLGSPWQGRRLPVRWPAAEAVFSQPAPQGFFLLSDPPEHTRYRRLLTGQFTVRRMNQLRPRIEQIVDEQVEVMRQAGSSTDLVEAFALPVPSRTLCELLGVPYADHAQFQRINESLVDMGTSSAEALASWQQVNDYLRDLIRYKWAHPCNDLLGGLAASRELSEDELVAVAVQLLLAGFDTTANMLALGTFALLRNPAQVALLNADPSLINNAVEELLRYISVLQFTILRTALVDLEIEGHLVKQGETITISLPAANRDPDRFHDPDRLDIAGNAKGHLGFGHGIHQCIGQQLARLEMRIGFAALFRHFPNLRLAVSPDEVLLREDVASYGVHRLPVAW